MTADRILFMRYYARAFRRSAVTGALHLVQLVHARTPLVLLAADADVRSGHARARIAGGIAGHARAHLSRGHLRPAGVRQRRFVRAVWRLLQWPVRASQQL